MYYFLDVDGVLNNEQDWRKLFTINNGCLKCFREIVRHDDEPHIILPSTWRAGMTNTVITSGANGQFEKCMEQIGLKIEGITQLSNKSRQEEIEYYIRRNKVSKYLIIDDDATLFPRADKINIYFTSCKTGLTLVDVKRILKMTKRMK